MEGAESCPSSVADPLENPLFDADSQALLTAMVDFNPASPYSAPLHDKQPTQEVSGGRD